MFKENLLELRKKKGLTQEELAIRVNVVRQTVSKWEKGLSVPDAETLTKLAEVLEVSVSQLLGAKLEPDANVDVMAEQLARINEQLAIRNRRSQRIWNTVKIILGAIGVFFVLTILVGIMGTTLYMYTPRTSTVVEEVEDMEDIEGMEEVEDTEE